MLKNSLLELIGNTPIVRLTQIEKKYLLNCKLYAKIEYFNPAGSIKDRVASHLITVAEREGLLKPNGTIIEPTSGNTGIGLALVGKLKGYRVILTMPENMSVERIKILKSYGAEVVLTPKSEGMQGSIDKANELLKTIPNSYMPNQFENEENANAHFLTTGVEIYNDLGSNLDCLVAGVGTGGTITGTSRFLKEKINGFKAFGVEPSESAVLSGENKGVHGIQGIGAGFIPRVLDLSVLDGVIKVSTKTAIETAKELSSLEGLSVGISSGASVAGAIEVIKNNNFTSVLTILPDGASKYLSTELFN